MTGPYAYTPDIWPPLAAAIFVAALGWYAWRRRDVPAGKPFIAISVFASLMLLGIALEAAAVTSATKIAWYKFQFLMLMLAVTGGTCFSLEYTYPGRWLTRRNLILLSIAPLLTLLLIAVNDSRFMWRLLEVAPDRSVVSYYALPGGILVAYAWGLVLVNATAFVWLFIRSPQHRWPVAVMLFGQLVGRAAYLLNFAMPSPTQINPTVLATFAPWTGYAIALFGFRIFDPLPTARQAVIEQMHAGMVVFDTGRRVVSLNPAAETILGMPDRAARGKTWEQLVPPSARLPALPDASTRPGGTETELPEMTFGSGAATRHYAPAFFPLRDFRGLLMGYLLMLSDVTEQHRAQVQLLGQQTAMAALREREQIARELHDGLGQVLGYVKLQAQAARDLLAQERKTEADNCLAQLVAVAQDVHADMREYIFEASTASPIELGFRASLQQYLQRFSQTYQICAELEMPQDLTDDRFEPTVAVQLLRIIQEALTNARKHAHASLVRVSLVGRDGTAEVTITDDGRGFDPDQAAGDRFGLRFMRERAQAVGGSLQVRSALGQGTAIQVRVPLGKDGGS